MYLYEVSLGNLDVVSGDWTVATNTMGNNNGYSLQKSEIHQFIRINKDVDCSELSVGALTPEWAASNMRCYHLLANSRWVNNNRSMNPLLMPQKKDATSEQIVVYINVASNYNMLRFFTPHRILQTYHVKDTLQGCAVVLDTAQREENKTIINIKAYDKKKDAYVNFKIAFNDKDITKTVVIRTNITDRKTIDQLKSSRVPGRFMSFKIITKPGDILTMTYLVAPSMKDTVKELTKGIRNVRVYEVDPDLMKNDEEYQKDKLAMIGDDLRANNIRAITQIGVQIPLYAAREMRLLYVFNYDQKNNVLSCRKSN